MRNNKPRDTTMEDKENEPPKKKLRLSLSKNRNRFIRVTEHELSEAKRGYVPDNTSRSTKWAVSNFYSRGVGRKLRKGGNCYGAQSAPRNFSRPRPFGGVVTPFSAVLTIEEYIFFAVYIFNKFILKKKYQKT